MAEKVHMCETCGKATEKFGHLCNPVEVDEAYVCDHCGQASTDPRHICKPKLQNINFVCIACGRVAELPSELCNPRDIELMKRQDPPTRITQTLFNNFNIKKITAFMAPVAPFLFQYVKPKPTFPFRGCPTTSKFPPPPLYPLPPGEGKGSYRTASQGDFVYQRQRQGGGK